MKYPHIKYHKDKAPDGRLIRSESELPTGPGWCDSPDELDKPVEREPEPAPVAVEAPKVEPPKVESPKAQPPKKKSWSK